jgi:hypothetical protein
MSERRLVRHPDLPDVVRDVPAAAVGQMGSAGWVELDAAELKAYAKRLVDEKAERLAALSARPAAPKKAPSPRAAKKSDPTPENESDH